MRAKYTREKLRTEYKKELADYNGHRNDFISHYVRESCNPGKVAEGNARGVLILAIELRKRCEDECNIPNPRGRTTDAIDQDIEDLIMKADHLPGFETSHDPRYCMVSVYFKSRMQGREPGHDSDRFAVPSSDRPNWNRDFLPHIGTEYEA